MKYLTFLVFLLDTALSVVPCYFIGHYISTVFTPPTEQNILTASTVLLVFVFLYLGIYRALTRPIFRAYVRWSDNKMWEKTIRNIDTTLIELKKEYGDARRTQRNLSGRVTPNLTPGDPPAN